MNNSISAIIFDLDGVLCHTDQFHYLAWKELADTLGVFFNQEINNRLRGVSRQQSLEILLENYPETVSDQQKKNYADIKNQTYRKLLHTMDRKDLHPEVKFTLETLRQKGYKLAIGSSSKNAPLILEKIGLSEFFDAVADGNQITHSKPDPEVFLLAASLLGVNGSECLVVEDAEVGILAAHAANMQAAAIGDAAKARIAKYNLSKLTDLLHHV